MKVLVIGGGGREHALAWKLAQSQDVSEVLIAPGNAGTAGEPKCRNIAVAVDDIAGLVAAAQQSGVELTVVGPEVPLVLGVVDAFEAAGLTIFGPSQAAAELEGSKAFTKDFLARHNIPSGRYQNFTEIEPALAFCETMGAPLVVKADGLAAGKGVIIAATVAEAQDAVRDMLAGNAFGEAGHRVVIEEFLDGEEASFICMVDGLDVLPMATSQDHKAAHEGDKGPNTGGMGAYSPAPCVDDAMHDAIMQQVIMPTVQAMLAEGRRYRGFLYAGIMICDGVPKVLEYNCRFGDPETQPIMMRLQSDLLPVLLAACEGRLPSQHIDWDPRVALGVVLAAPGYPGNYPKGATISDRGQDSDDQKVFHAGTAAGDGIVTSGGRVLCATALADTVAEAQAAANRRAGEVDFDGRWFRTDIGHRAISREA
ncbi:phosphoribosylamine--glycine ligase [Litorivicinus lipolyticus]|uniref:Phosphoribosylamine--glycine ligase n=1 Tax=Litorivicinus lipolyticus TaxID=418701 RepID=A0A5Q2Q8M5_9GAMM|nr:phosphoribosylamine--glycine ligase [Litorivicinus lipolyticus]QGG81059.1 phosphoribosylamine--glycine ligase [Litorivicinus lipolyticus]